MLRGSRLYTCQICLYIRSPLPSQSWLVCTVISTRKDVGAECRHDMRPSFQLPRPNNGLRLVCSRRLSYWAPPLINMYVRYAAIFFRFLTSGDLDLFKWKLSLHLLVPWETFIGPPPTNFDYSKFFCYRVTSPYGTYRRTDKTRSDE